MKSYVTRNISMLRSFASALLLLQLAACGTIISPRSASVPTPTLSSLPPQFFSSNSTDLTSKFEISQGLLIAPERGTCGTNGFPTNIVLTTDRLTYDAGEIQQMSKFFNDYFAAASWWLSTPDNLPPTLRYALGYFPNDIGSWNMVNTGPYMCKMSMTVTNVGSATIQVDQVSLKVTRDALPNTFQYRFIDACSLDISPKGKCSLGRGGGEPYYIYDYQLGAEKANTIVSSSSVTPGLTFDTHGNLAEGSITITLNPGDTTDIHLVFEGKDSAHDYIYSLIPQFHLHLRNEVQTVDLPQLAGNVAILNPQTQSKCYRFQGQALVPITPIPLSTSAKNLDESVLCL